jgi:hypothetical protein
MDEHEALLQLFRDSPAAAKLLATLPANKIQSIDDLPPGTPIVMVGAWNHAGITGSKQGRCAMCNAILWLAPSSLEVIEQKKSSITISCVLCAMKKVVEHVAGVNP